MLFTLLIKDNVCVYSVQKRFVRIFQERNDLECEQCRDIDPFQSVQALDKIRFGRLHTQQGYETFTKKLDRGFQQSAQQAGSKHRIEG